MDFTQLHCFLEVCRTKNISAAAKQLGVSQPTLSRYIKALETELGFAVLERNTKSVEMTPEGAFLNTAFAEIVKQTEAAVEQARTLQKKQLRIGVLGKLRRQLVQEFLRTMQNKYPDTELKIEILNEPALAEAFNRGTIDVALAAREGRLPFKDPYPVPLQEIPLVLFCSDESEIARHGIDWLRSNVGTLVCLDEHEVPGLLDFFTQVCERLGIAVFDVARAEELASPILYEHEKTGFTFFPEGVPMLQLGHAWSFPLELDLCFHVEAYFHEETEL